MSVKPEDIDKLVRKMDSVRKAVPDDSSAVHDNLVFAILRDIAIIRAARGPQAKEIYSQLVKKYEGNNAQHIIQRLVEPPASVVATGPALSTTVEPQKPVYSNRMANEVNQLAEAFQEQGQKGLARKLIEIAKNIQDNHRTPQEVQTDMGAFIKEAKFNIGYNSKDPTFKAKFTAGLNNLKKLIETPSVDASVQARQEMTSNRLEQKTPTAPKPTK